MKQVRNKVFETNSSSTHSISIGQNKFDNMRKSTLPINDDGTVSVVFGEFGWEEREYSDIVTKFAYLCTMWFMLEGCNCKNVEDLPKTEGYRLIEEGITSSLSNVKSLRINNEDEGDDKIFVKKHYNSEGTYLDIDGYIDHQSVPSTYNKDIGKWECPSLKEWLTAEGLTISNFVFDHTVVLQTGNDN